MFRRTVGPPTGHVLPYRPQFWRKLCWWGSIGAWFCRRAYRLSRWAVRHWEVGVAAPLVVGLWFLMDALEERRWVLLLGGLILASWTWCMFLPGREERPVRSMWRRFWVYRRRWDPVLRLAGLVPYDELPELLSVRSTDRGDDVTVRLVDGQLIGDWSSRIDRLAEAFDGAPAWVAPGKRRGTVLLTFTASRVRDFPKDGRW